MNPDRLTKVDAATWRIEPTGPMLVPAIIYADESLIRDMDDKVGEQAANVASLPGVVQACYVMPDAHWGYGFPIGGVAAFDPESGRRRLGGRRRLRHFVRRPHDAHRPLGRRRSARPEGARRLALSRHPGGPRQPQRDHARLRAKWTRCSLAAPIGRWRAVGESPQDLERIEDGGRIAGAEPDAVSERAKQRQTREMGTLGSGNHYLEAQVVAEIFDQPAAAAFGLKKSDVVVAIHCGSRGLGHQVATDFAKDMVVAAQAAGIALPDRELACAPIKSEVGRRYLGAMRAAMNCALANREILGHYARGVFRHFFPGCELSLLFDVSHNTCKVESHVIDGKRRELFVHRKGATRAFGPGRDSLPPALRPIGQPVFIGGSMGTASYILAGEESAEAKAFASACHGAGRALSRHAALRQWSGRQIIDELAAQGVMIRSPSSRGVAEEAPGAYKDVSAVVVAAEAAGLARRVARLRPLICIKG